jgi:prepilin-type N-terminal cleavage/methylation domain-containing protein
MPRKPRGFSLTELMIVIAIISILALVGIVNYSRSRARAHYQACIVNVKNLGTACEMWARDHDNHYNVNLASLTPNYMKIIPTCPAVGATTYNAAGGFASASNPDAYTITCAGTNHRAMTTNLNFPQYTSAGGLKEN